MSDAGSNTTDTGRIIQYMNKGNLSKTRSYSLSPVSNNKANQQGSPSYHDLPTISSINSQDENLLMSTKHNFDDEDSHLLPKLRSTAQKYGRYNPPQPQSAIRTSAVHRAFQDFDEDAMSDHEDSIEIGRGYQVPQDMTPSKIGSSGLFGQQINDSFHTAKAGTPQTRPKPRTRKSDGAEPDLRRHAMRRASGIADGINTSPKKSGAAGRRIASSSDAHAKPIRAQPRSPQVQPGELTGYGRASSEPPMDEHTRSLLTPRKSAQPGTPRSAINTTTSFALPDMSNLTDIIRDPDTYRMRSAKGPSQYKSAGSRCAVSVPNYADVESVPLPLEEEQIRNGLMKLETQLRDLRLEKEAAQDQVADLESEVEELRAALGSQERKSGKDEHTGSFKWRFEKTKLEALVRSLQRKVDQNQTTIIRLTEERDSALQEIATNAQERQEIEEAYFELQENYQNLDDEYLKAQSENEELHIQLEKAQSKADESHLRHEVESARHIQRAATTARRNAASMQEHEELRARNEELEAQVEEHTARLPQLRKAAIRVANRQVETETVHLQVEIDRLQSELAAKQQAMRRQVQQQAQAKDQRQVLHDFTARTAASRGATARDVTLTRQQMADKTGQTIGIADLQQQLADTEQQHEEESLKWRTREALLREQIDILTATKQTSSQRTFGPVSSKNVQTARPRSRSTLRNIIRNKETMANDDVESTTNLDLLDRRPTSRLENQQVSATRQSVQHNDDDDATELSHIDDYQIADLRRRLEEERRARRASRNQTTVTGGQQRSKSRSRSPVKNRQPYVEDDAVSGHSIPVPSDDGSVEILETQDIIAESTRKSGTPYPRRRKSSFREMTSAFIIPDITLDATQLTPAGKDHRNSSDAATNNGLHITHDPKSCNFCQRLTDASQKHPLKLSSIVPASLRKDLIEDPDSTQRPTQSPQTALCSVLKSLYDEHAHLHMELSRAQLELQSLDPAVSRRRHEQVHSRIQKITLNMREKERQIYELFDVVEAHKDVLGARGEQDEDKESKKLLEQIRKKRVEFEDLTGRSVVSELPWEGISDANSEL